MLPQPPDDLSTPATGRTLAAAASFDHEMGWCCCDDEWRCETAPETAAALTENTARVAADKQRIAVDRAAGRLWLGGDRYIACDWGEMTDPDLRLVQPDIEATPGEQWWRPWPDLDNIPEPDPLIVTEEGQTLIPASGLTMLYGPMASGKSWAALGIAVVAAVNGGRAVLVDSEMGLIPTARRIRPLCGAPPEGLRYAAKASPVEIIEWLAGATRRLVVLDTVGSLGGHTNDAAEFVAWHANNIQPFLDADIAVLAVDHDIRSKAGQKDRMQHGAIGSAAKGNLCDLIYQVVGADWTGTRGGSAQMILRKDRHGIHPTPANSVAAELRITYDAHGGMDYAFHNAEGADPTPAGGPSQRIADRIRTDIEEHLGRAPQGMTKRQIRKLVTGKAAHIDHILQEMVADDTLHHDGEAYIHHGYEQNIT